MAVVWAVLVTLLAVGVLDLIRREDQASRVRFEVDAIAALVLPVLERTSGHPGGQALENAARSIVGTRKLLGLTVFAPDRMLFASEPAALEQSALLTTWPAGPAGYHEVELGNAQGVARFVTLPNGGGFWLVVDRASVVEANRRFYTMAFLLVLGVAGLTLAVASLWVEALVRPIDALTRSAAALIHGDVTARHDDKGPAEVRFLARRFNQLADWLQASSAHISRLAADLDRQVHDRVREIEEANRQLAELAHTDPLTGLINRRGLEMELARYLTLARRHQHSLGVIMMDLDNFKVYNDRCGHLSGDTVLRTVADALKAKARSSDVVSRWGGDEFCILIPAVDTPGALAAAQRYVSGVLGALGDLSRVDVSACLGCSAGVACYPQHGEEATELIARADTALYRVKAQGGSAVLLAAEVEATDEDSGSFQALVG